MRRLHREVNERRSLRVAHSGVVPTSRSIRPRASRTSGTVRSRLDLREVRRTAALGHEIECEKKGGVKQQSERDAHHPEMALPRKGEVAESALRFIKRFV